MTFEQIRSLRLKGSDSGHVYRVPTFKEALAEAKGKIMVDIDMKSAPVSKLVAIVHQMDAGDQVIFFDSDFAVLDSVKLLDSTLMVMPRAHSPEKLEWMLDHYQPPVIHIDPSFFTSEVVMTIKNGGARIWINALGKPDLMAASGMVDLSYGALVDGGANIIQTDRPAALLKYVIRKGRHW
jgi:glycerophosphoryl diester phosphodiesterase